MTSWNSQTDDLWGVQLKPQAFHRQLIRKLLESRGAVKVKIEMEILELNGSGLALVWIPDQLKRQKPQLAVVRIPELIRQQIEKTRPLNLLPVLKLSFTVLGEETPGVFTAVTSHPLGELAYKAPEVQGLEELIGNHANPGFC